MKAVLLGLLGLMTGSFMGNPLHAQAASAGVYTAEQAKLGQALYQAQCTSCHIVDMQGSGQTPPLSGSDFMTNWAGQTVAGLFDKIQSSMPADHPGTLTRQQVTDLTALLLSSNKFPPGTAELPTDEQSLKKILIDPPPPPKS